MRGRVSSSRCLVLFRATCSVAVLPERIIRNYPGTHGGFHGGACVSSPRAILAIARFPPSPSRVTWETRYFRSRRCEISLTPIRALRALLTSPSPSSLFDPPVTHRFSRVLLFHARLLRVRARASNGIASVKAYAAEEVHESSAAWNDYARSRLYVPESTGSHDLGLCHCDLYRCVFLRHVQLNSKNLTKNLASRVERSA